jgi:uncharacterized membrane protein YtjA (UPF0391 family)
MLAFWVLLHGVAGVELAQGVWRVAGLGAGELAVALPVAAITSPRLAGARHGAAGRVVPGCAERAGRLGRDGAEITSAVGNTLLKEKRAMLRLAVVFLVIALVAALFGFGEMASYSWEGAKIVFAVFLVLAVLSFLGGTFRGGAFWK